jgi:hypothetical protein
VGKSSTKILATPVIFKKLPIVNNRPIGRKFDQSGHTFLSRHFALKTPANTNRCLVLKMSKLNNRPMYENSTNLVTLCATTLVKVVPK